MFLFILDLDIKPFGVRKLENIKHEFNHKTTNWNNLNFSNQLEMENSFLGETLLHGHWNQQQKKMVLLALVMWLNTHRDVVLGVLLWADKR